jgi:5-methylcytosine-specific restriction enzyme A
MPLFEVGGLYRRGDLHDQYGGQRQGGISTPAEEPFIMLFTSDRGQAYGYHDGWDADGLFRYPGEGQVGDMAFLRGNAAIRDHAAQGKDLHLFDYERKGQVRYRGQMVCAGYTLVDGVPDRNGDPRQAIMFYLMEATTLATEMATELPPRESDNEILPAEASLEQLRAIALGEAQRPMNPREAKRWLYRRSEAVRQYVLRRAAGFCEGCGQEAPFVTEAGGPYLEPHHVRRLSDGGPDHPAWVIALCPNCHRHAHYGRDHEVFNRSLIAKLASRESVFGRG